MSEALNEKRTALTHVLLAFGNALQVLTFSQRIDALTLAADQIEEIFAAAQGQITQIVEGDSE